jgi:hypothetical protein
MPQRHSNRWERGLTARETAPANVERRHVSQEVHVPAPLAPRRQLAICDGYGHQLDRSKIQACVKFTQGTGRRTEETRTAS